MRIKASAKTTQSSVPWLLPPTDFFPVRIISLLVDRECDDLVVDIQFKNAVTGDDAFELKVGY